MINISDLWSYQEVQDSFRVKIAQAWSDPLTPRAQHLTEP
jgi:hypothetical protein